MKNFLVGLLMAFALVGCGAKLDYGVYNIGVCSASRDVFIASNVDVESQTFTVMANASGPTQVTKLDQPLVLKYVTDVGGFRKYVASVKGHEDEVLVKVQNGVLEGFFSVQDVQVASLHGHKGQLENLGLDGNAEAQACFGE